MVGHLILGTWRNQIHLGTYCGDIPTPTIVRSPYRTNEVMFRTTFFVDNYTDLGFNLTYKIFNCGGRLNGPVDIIQSISFPRQYPANTDCAWLLEYPEGEQIVVCV